MGRAGTAASRAGRRGARPLDVAHAALGRGPGGSQQLWALPASSGLTANGEADPSSRFDAEVGYGVALFGDRFTGTSNVGFGMSETARDYRVGWRLTLAVKGEPDFEVSLDATQRGAVNDNAAEHSVMLRSLVRWQGPGGQREFDRTQEFRRAP